MNKKIIYIFLFGLITIFSYQNCYQPQKLAEKNVDSAPVSSEVALVDQSIEKITFTESVIVNQEINGKTISVKTNALFEIDYQSGRMLQKDQNTDEVLNQYCLSSNLKVELIQILEGSKVCFVQKEIPAGQVCAAVIQNPYSKILTSKDEYQLGYATDSCESQKVDLCDNNGELLKGWWKHVYTNISSLTCP